MRRSIPLLLAVLLAAAAPAAAQDPAAPAQQPAPPQQQPPPPPPPPPPPAEAQLQVTTQGVGPDGAVLAGTAWRVVGRLQPAADGQHVVVRLYSRGKKIAAKRAPVRNGRFGARFRLRNAASLAVRVVHRATPELGRASAGLRLDVLPRRVEAGQTGTAVRILQRHLARKGYVVGRRGVMDGRTQRAIIAFRKVTGMARTAAANRAMLARLARGGGTFRLRYPGVKGRHVEADLSRQVLVLARGSKVERIYHTSSGAGGTPTIRGTFRFYLAQPGYNASQMYFSKYFIRGYAIHGYASVPVYPASHGCLRVPLDDAVSIYNWIQLGDRIDVYA
jgi:hypothetical protein